MTRCRSTPDGGYRTDQHFDECADQLAAEADEYAQGSQLSGSNE